MADTDAYEAQLYEVEDGLWEARVFLVRTGPALGSGFKAPVGHTKQHGLKPRVLEEATAIAHRPPGDGDGAARPRLGLAPRAASLVRF